MLARTLIALLVFASLALSSAAHADEPFYKNKRLTLLINFAVGGPADVEGRLFAKYIGRHIAGEPGVLVQNMEGAGGVVGAKYLGAAAPKDGTVVGYFTGTGFIYAIDPSRFDPDFLSYGFVAIQGGATVAYVRADVPPGMKTASDIAKAQGLIVGGLSVDTSKDVRMRLALDLLGLKYKYVTG
jgi:tripartite-type tricarboxylate transporter receptor subunit TctC